MQWGANPGTEIKISRIRNEIRKNCKEYLNTIGVRFHTCPPESEDKNCKDNERSYKERQCLSQYNGGSGFTPVSPRTKIKIEKIKNARMKGNI